MKVKIVYFGQARQAAGTGSESIEVAAGASVPDVLRQSAETHGEALRKLLFASDGAVRRSVLTPLNGKALSAGVTAELKDGDEISVFTALSGG